MASRLCLIASSRADFDLLSLLAKEAVRRAEIEVNFLSLDDALGQPLESLVSSLGTQYLRPQTVDCSPVGKGVGSVAKGLGSGFEKLTGALENQAPTWTVLLGDRVETLFAGIASSLLNIPIAHIHGGEKTLGAIDDGFRNALTVLSQAHFVVSEVERRRVAEIAGSPDNIHIVGLLGMELVGNSPPKPQDELEKLLGVRFDQHNILVTLHPETRDPQNDLNRLEALLGALSGVEDASLFFTGANSDVNGLEMNDRILQFIRGASNRWFFPSLGAENYHAIARHCELVIGNSSSGLYEVPFLGVPVINIGDRQRGRKLPPGVKSVTGRKDELALAIQQTLSGGRMVQGLGQYTHRRASSLILDALEETTRPYRLGN